MFVKSYLIYCINLCRSLVLSRQISVLCESISVNYCSISIHFDSISVRYHSISVHYRGRSRGAPCARPPKIAKIWFFFSQNRDFSHEIPQQISRLPPLSAIFLSPPPPLLETLDPPLHCHSISVIRLGVMFVLNLFVHGTLYTLCV